MRSSILLLLLIATAAIHAQPAGTTFSTLQVLQSGADSLAILTEHDGATVSVGMVILTTTVGEATITRVEYLVIGENPPMRADSFLLVRESLLPVASCKQGDHPRDILFEKGGVRIIDADSSRTLPPSMKAFYAGSTDLLLRSLPLEVGYATVLPLFSEATGSPIDAHVTVDRTGDGADVRRRTL